MKMNIENENRRIIYADNAATTELDSEAFEAMLPFLRFQYGNASQPYSLGVESKKALNKARETIAECICCEPNEIYFTSGGTESDNHALKLGFKIESADNRRQIVTSPIEHHAVLNSCKALEKEKNAEVKYVPVSPSGEIILPEYEKMLSSCVKIVSIMTANNEIGTVQPVAHLAKIAKESGAIFHTDAVAALGHIAVNVKDSGIDMLSASAHKFNGPKGIGFLYVKNGIKIKPFLDGGSQESGLRAGTENVAAIVAMAQALKNNTEHLAENEKHLKELEDLLLSRLRLLRIDFVQNGSGKTKVAGNISLSFAGVSGETLLHRLDLKGICVSTGSACDGKKTQVSHVIQAIKTPSKYAEGTVRVSLGKRNTKEEVMKIADALESILL